jgi:hypothetical protein
MKFSIVILLGLMMVALACADRKNLSPLPSVSEEAKTELEQPVNCDSAESDLKVLEEEKASVVKQLLSGVRSLMPVAVAAGILMGDYRDRVMVATGKYNSDIETKIAQIKRDCHLR